VVRLADDEIITRLTEARGVGRWTVEMMLMFTLGRPDVLPVDDYGVRYGYRMAYGLKALPTPKALMEFGERWRPHRTTASWYLWRAAEQARAAALKPRPVAKSRAGKRAAKRGTELVR
jgi:3-methyladenine DNA glycosylase/8-oxoguanine DNA glycosylase